MIVEKLKELLEQNIDAQLSILLPSSTEYIPNHFHITEVGRVEKTFIDCGGTLRSKITCALQVWVAKDINHRLTSTKLLKILNLADSLNINELDIEIEYGTEIKSQFMLKDVNVIPRHHHKELLFVLSGVKTDCLAPDKCGINIVCSGNNCC